MSGESWDAWVKHVMAVGPTWLYVVVCISELLCLRVTECLRLNCMDGLVYLVYYGFRRQYVVDVCFFAVVKQYVQQFMFRRPEANTYDF